MQYTGQAMKKGDDKKIIVTDSNSLQWIQRLYASLTRHSQWRMALHGSRKFTDGKPWAILLIICKRWLTLKHYLSETVEAHMQPNRIICKYFVCHIFWIYFWKYLWQYLNGGFKTMILVFPLIQFYTIWESIKSSFVHIAKQYWHVQ